MKQLAVFLFVCCCLLFPYRRTSAQTRSEAVIKGLVKDASGQPLPGVSVVFKGTTQGTVTDADGAYTIRPTGDERVLVFSFIGKLSQEVTINGFSEVNVTLKDDVANLDELVVVGYGTQKKATLTGSVANIGSKELIASPAMGVSNALAGLMPGLTAMNRTGEPGANVSTLLIRGSSTTGENAPLVVVDGVQNPVGWERINQNDIENISILKDAAAAIYGSQAANGVILITTKRGKTGKPVISYSFNQALNQPTRLPELASSAQFAEYLNDLRRESGQNLAYTDEEIRKFRDGSDPVNYPNTDWFGEVLKKVSSQSMHNLNVRGGSEQVTYSLSGSYSDQNSIFKKGMHRFKGYTLRANTDARINPYIKINLDINAGLDNRTQPGTESPWSWFNALPMMPVYYANGYPSAGIEQGLNPAVMVTSQSGDHNTKVRRFETKAGFAVKAPWLEGLGADGYFVYNDVATNNKRWRTPWTVYNYNKVTNQYLPLTGGRLTAPELTQSVENIATNFYNLRLTYEKQMGDHYLNTFVAFEQSKGQKTYLEAYRRNYLSSELGELFAGDPATARNEGRSSPSARQSYFGKIGYNFREKYLVDFNIRYDGSYAFPVNKRWGFFPGVSVAWVLSEEQFLKNSSQVSELKIRASSGRMGNDRILPYQDLAAFLLTNNGYHFGQAPVSSLGLEPGVTPNKNITWEVAENHNLGLDAAFWRGKLGISLDVFQQQRSNILTSRNLEIPAYLYLTLPDENVGVVRNRGFELQLTHRNQPAGQQVQYQLGANIAFAKSKVIDLSEPQNVPGYQKAEGHMLGSGLYYEAIGIIRTEAELTESAIYQGSKVGDLKYRDVDGNGIIDPRDRVRFDRSNIPQLTFGFNGSARYRNFSLFFNFAGQGNAWQYIHQYASVAINTQADLLENRYRTGSMDSKYPRLPTNSSINGEPSSLQSTFWLQNAAFVRLKTFDLGYELPGKILGKTPFSQVRIFLNGNNLLTFTPMKWVDPEGNATNGAFYPQNKIFNLGINVSL